MEMTYRLTYYNGPQLELQIHTQSATDYALVSDNLFTHGEYETKWDMKSQEWIDKGYFKQCFHEKFKGSSDVIFIMRFIIFAKCNHCVFTINSFHYTRITFGNGTNISQFIFWHIL